MDKNPLPPPYPGPAYPPPPVFQAAPALTVAQPGVQQVGQPIMQQVGQPIMQQVGQPIMQQVGQQVVQPPMTIVQQAPPPSYIQSVVQPGVAVIEQVPQPAIIHQAIQPNVTVVQQAPPTVIQSAVQQPVMVVNTVVALPRLSEVPAHIRCNLCGQEIITAIRYINGGLVWGLFAGLCLFGIWPCCLIPFCVDSCKDVEHSCPNCQNIISVYKRG